MKFEPDQKNLVRPTFADSLYSNFCVIASKLSWERIFQLSMLNFHEQELFVGASVPITDSLAIFKWRI